jgi:hypothetical protein
MKVKGLTHSQFSASDVRCWTIVVWFHIWFLLRDIFNSSLFINVQTVVSELSVTFMFIVPFILVMYIFHWKSNEMHTDFLRILCFTIFALHVACVIYPSSGAQTAKYSRRYAWLLKYVRSWIIHWSRLRLGHHHTYSTVNWPSVCHCYHLNYMRTFIYTRISFFWCMTLRQWAVGFQNFKEFSSHFSTLEDKHDTFSWDVWIRWPFGVTSCTKRTNFPATLKWKL